jgi:hypothetical protein
MKEEKATIRLAWKQPDDYAPGELVTWERELPQPWWRRLLRRPVRYVTETYQAQWRIRR